MGKKIKIEIKWKIAIYFSFCLLILGWNMASEYSEWYQSRIRGKYLTSIEKRKLEIIFDKKIKPILESLWVME